MDEAVVHYDGTEAGDDRSRCFFCWNRCHRERQFANLSKAWLRGKQAGEERGEECTMRFRCTVSNPSEVLRTNRYSVVVLCCVVVMVVVAGL